MQISNRPSAMRMRRLVTMSGRTSLTYHNIIAAFHIKIQTIVTFYALFILDFLKCYKIVYVFADQMSMSML